LEQAGFRRVALVEIDKLACETLRNNRREWNVIEGDVRSFSAKAYIGLDLIAGGDPCPPFSIAGKQLGQDDERDLFPKALRLVAECDPKALMLENVKGLFSCKFDHYRQQIIDSFASLGYQGFWELVEADHYGVPQQRSRAVLVALKEENARYFVWPLGINFFSYVGEVLGSDELREVAGVKQQI